MVIISQDRSLVLNTSSDKLVFRTEFPDENIGQEYFLIYVDYVEDGVKLSYCVAEYVNEKIYKHVMHELIKIQCNHGMLIDPIDCIDFSTL